MIYGIGVDIAEIARFKQLIKRFGERIARRILTDAELDQFLKRKKSPSFLASRFAAKEAVSKAFGTGIAQGIGFKSIEVINDDFGKPELVLHDKALVMMKRHCISRCLLTLSDEKHYCVAMVVMEID